MGNYRFKLSDMIPNAWFYKLHKDMNRSSNNTLPLQAPAPASIKKKHHLVQHLSDLPPTPPPPTQPNNNLSSSSSQLARKSYYFPRSKSRPSSATASVDSSTTTTKTTTTHHHYTPDSSSSSSSSSSSASSSFSSVLLFESSPELRLDRVLTPETTSLCEKGSAVHHNSFLLPNNNKKRLDDMFDELELELPRIVTKPAVKLNYPDDHHCIIYSQKLRATHKTMTSTSSSRSSKLVPLHHHHNNNIRSTPRRLSVLSPGKKIKIRSPKIDQARRMSKKRPLSDSFAIVKSSFDPHSDFRESMLEMIVEHNIKGSKDLEDLLACYLSLNSDEYHHLIIKVFKQIWFDLTDIIN